MADVKAKIEVTDKELVEQNLKIKGAIQSDFIWPTCHKKFIASLLPYYICNTIS